MKGIDTGMPVGTKTPIHVAELGGTRRWVNAKCYPLVKRYTALYLSRGNKLSMASQVDEEEAALQWVPQEQAGTSVEYTTEPFVRGAMLAGPLSAELQVTSSNSNVQLFVELFDRAPAGAQTKPGFGSIVSTLRTLDPPRWSARLAAQSAAARARRLADGQQDRGLTHGELGESAAHRLVKALP